jgi:hypothetical protein
MRRASIALGFVSAFWVAGCGVGVDSLFASGSGGGSQGGSGQGGVASGNPTAGGRGGSPTTATSMHGPSASSSESSSASSTAMSSTASGNQPDLVCGDTKCEHTGGHGCCWDTFMQSDPPYAKCVEGPPGQNGCNTFQGDGGYEAFITCQTAAQCPVTEVCCGHRIFVGGSAAYYDRVDCQSTCNDPNVQLCDPSMPDATVCPIDMSGGIPRQQHCQPSQLLPTDGTGNPEYFVCVTP